jgi:hypothetical protein
MSHPPRSVHGERTTLSAVPLEHSLRLEENAAVFHFHIQQAIEL